MMATRLSETLHYNGNRSQVKRPYHIRAQNDEVKSAAIQNCPWLTKSPKMTVYVRLPCQKTICVQVDSNLHSLAKLRHYICNQTGLPDNESTILTHLGKSLDFGKFKEQSSFVGNLLNDFRKYHLATIQVCLMLPGGVDKVISEASGDLEAASWADLKKFMKFIGSLSLTDAETMRLADSLSDLQKQNLSKIVKNKLSKFEILAFLQNLNDSQVRGAFRDLKIAMHRKTEDQETKNFQLEVLQAIDRKIGSDIIQINLQDLLICQAFQKSQKNLFSGLSNKQWSQYFFDFILESDQLKLLFKLLKKQKIESDHGESIVEEEKSISELNKEWKDTRYDHRPRASKFWSNLRSDQQAVIFTLSTYTQQKKMLLSPRSIITSTQQAQLWDIILFKRQADQIWSHLTEKEKSQSLLIMSTETQIGLWQQICKEDQMQLLNLLRDKDLKVKFWSKMSCQQQDQALSILTLQSTQDLLEQLDQESLCLTICMHKNKVLACGETLIDLLTGEKRLAVETFLKYGKSSKNDCTSEQFIDKLVDQQYAGFSSFRNLQPDYSYVQFIENPDIENGYIALADVQNEVKLHDFDLKTLDSEENQKFNDVDASEQMSQSLTKMKSPSLENSQQSENLPITLEATLVKEEGRNYKEWQMDQANPDPVLNKENKSVISSFEHLGKEDGFWCTKSFTIINRMSKIYSGQDDDLFIFSREQPTPEPESKEAQNQVEEANNILLTVFRFLIDSSLVSNYVPREIHTILQDSHLGKELLKTEQVKKGDKIQYMDQAPNLIKNGGKLFLAYTSATVEEGPCLYFYDLENRRTCAKVSQADLLIDCYPHQTDEGLTMIRYILDETIYERSVDFMQFKSNEHSLDQRILELAQDDSNLVNISEQIITQANGNPHSVRVWNNRYGGHGLRCEAFVHVKKYEYKANINKSFIIMLKIRENQENEEQNQSFCFQSYEGKTTAKEQQKQRKGQNSKHTAATKKVTFKLAKSIGYCESIATRKSSPSNKNNDETFVLVQFYKDEGQHRQMTLVYTSVPESDIRTTDTLYNDGSKKWNQSRQIQLHFQEKNKLQLGIPIFFWDKKIISLFCSMNCQLSHYSQKEENKDKVQLKPLLQEKKLWKNMMVSYPFLFYTGLTPECREIVVANLAATKSPQKIIQLPDGVQLQNLIGSHLDDRIFFNAFRPHSGSRGDFELVLRHPFKTIENQDHHNVFIRRTHLGNGKDKYCIDQARLSQVDFIADKNSVDNRLFWVNANDSYLKCIAGELATKKLLDYQISSLDNIYWLEDHPTSGNILRGIIQISNTNNGTSNKTDINQLNLGDIIFKSIVVETKNQKDFVTLLDQDHNLYSFSVNKATRCFEKVHEIKNIDGQLQIDNEWLILNEKAKFSNENYKADYKLFSSETVGVVLKDLDFIVYYNVNSKTFSMVNTAHKKFPIPSSDDKSQMEVTWTKNCDGSDFRLMDCKVKETQHRRRQNYFVVYPSPESRKLDLFGFQGLQNNRSTSFISENLYLAQFQYRDVYQDLHSPGYLKHESNYWSVVDQTGQIQQQTLLEIEENSSVIFSSQTEQGSIIILNHKTKNQIVKFNLKGELDFNYSFDDKDCFLETIQIVQNQLNLEDSVSFSKTFLRTSEGNLYRIATILNIHDGQEVKDDTSFFLGGAVRIPIGNSESSQFDLTVLIFVCRSEAQFKQFEEAIFHISKNKLCIYSPKFADKAIRIINLQRAAIEKKVNKIEGKSQMGSNWQEKKQPTATSKPQEYNNTEALRVYKLIGKRSKNEIAPQDDLSSQKIDLQSKKEITWIAFDEKIPEQKIDIEQLTHHYSRDQFSLVLDSFDLTTKQLKLNFQGHEVEATEDQNYLQISLSDRVILYDLSYKEPKECFSCFQMNCFTDPRNFVDLGLQVILTKTQKEDLRWRKITACHQRNVFMVEDIIKILELDDGLPNPSPKVVKSHQHQFKYLLKNHSFSDLQGLDILNARLRENTSIQANSFESTMVSYQGHNIFSLFNSHRELKQILDFIHAQLDSRHQLKEDSQIDGSYYIRRIYQILTMPLPEFVQLQNDQENMLRLSEVESQDEQSQLRTDQEKAKYFQTALEQCIQQEVHLRDLFFKLAESSEEFHIQDFACDQVKMRKILHSYSSALHQFFKNQVIQTPITKSVTKLSWPSDAFKIPFTFKMSSQTISKKQVQKKVKNHFASLKTRINHLNQFKKYEILEVELKLMKNGWLLQEKDTFANFCQVLEECQSDRIFDTEFMRNLVEGYWDQNYRIINWFCFVSWLLYLATINILFQWILKPEDPNQDQIDEFQTDYKKYIFISLTLLFLSFQLWIEYVQLESFSCKGLKDHFTSLWNIVDLFQYSSTAWITLSNLPSGGSSMKEEQRIVAAFSLFVIWAKFFDWLRLFEPTTFYIRLLSQTIYDIRHFMILFCVTLAMFGSAMYMLQLNMHQTNDDEVNQIDNSKILEPENHVLIDEIFGVFFLDTLINQYLLSLGEFSFDGFNNHPQWYLCWMFFLVATFFTQITMLNMLIAIMGNTFQMVIEKKAIHAMHTKLQIMSDYSNVISLFDRDTDHFLFIVKPVIDDDEDIEDEASWEGGLSFLRKSITRKIEQINQNQIISKDQQITQANKIQYTIDRLREDNRKNINRSRGENKKLEQKIIDSQKEIMESQKKAMDSQNQAIKALDQKMELILATLSGTQYKTKSMAKYLEEITTVSLVWYRSLDQEDKAKVDADNDRSQAMKTAEFVAVWGLADIKEEEILYERDFTSLMMIQDQTKSARGVPNEPMTDEQRQLWYAFFDAQTPNEDGVSMKDFGEGCFAYLSAFKAKISE